MKCPKCKQDVSTVYGNGEYPNDSYRCDECCGRETGVVMTVFAVVFALVMVAIVCVSVWG